VGAIFATQRFVDTFDRQVWLRPVTQRAVWRLQDRVREAPDSWLRSYKSLEGYTPTVYRDRLAGNQRLLFTATPRGPVLLEMGPRDTIYASYTRQHLRSDLRSETRQLPSVLVDRQKNGLFLDVPAPPVDVALAPEEAGASWAQYLDEEQYDLATKIGVETLDLDSAKGQRRSWLITGGPGTGKTVVLLRLLMDAVDAGLRVKLAMSESVVVYHETALSHAGVRCQLTPVLGDPFSPFSRGDLRAQEEVDLLLVDDPNTLEQVKQALRWAEASRARAVVVAVDPLQMNETITDTEWSALTRPRQVSEESLTRCYRQKSAIGATSVKAMEVIGGSSPFGRDDKKRKELASRRRLTRRYNDLEFVNPGGSQRLHVPATIGDVESEVERLSAVRNGWWEHWSPLLVAVDDDLGPPAPELAQLLDRIPHQLVRLEQDPELDFKTVIPGVRSVKGAEFQHVMMFLSYPLYSELEQGFQAKGKNVYARRRLLRIPISRGKDSLVTYVWPRRFSNKSWPARVRAPRHTRSLETSGT
jgi:hypothetical protein